MASKGTESNAELTIPNLPSIKLDDLWRFVKLWDLVKANKSTYSHKAAWTKAFEDNETTTSAAKNAGKFVHDMEELFGLSNFFLVINKKLEVNPAKTTYVDQLRSLLDFLKFHSKCSHSSFAIRVGVGHSLAMSLAPAILEEFRRICPNVEVNFVIDDTDKLLKPLIEREIDCLLGVFSPEKNPSYNVHKLSLDRVIVPAVISRLSHAVARAYRKRGDNEHFDTSLLSPEIEIGVHVFDGAALSNPRDYLDSAPKVKFLSQPTYAAINEIVANGSDLGITLPQFLTKSQALNLQIMPIVISDARSPRLRLLSSLDTSKGHVQLMNEVTNREFEKALRSFLTVTHQTINRALDLPAVMDGLAPSYLLYLKLPILIDRNRNANPEVQMTWIKGEFNVYSIHQDSFTGELQLQDAIAANSRSKPFPYRRALSIKGNRHRAAPDAPKAFIVFRGRDESGEFESKMGVHRPIAGEIFTGSFIHSGEQQPSAGTWQGWEYSSETATSGPFLVFPKGSCPEIVTCKYLEELAIQLSSGQLSCFSQ
jgi:DNA-binding transcriptional LysR family regulator